MRRAARELVLLLAAAAVPALVSAAVQLTWRPSLPPNAREVPLTTALEWGSAVLWVDARPRAEFERGHMPGAVLLNEEEWVRLVGPFLEAWRAEKRIVVYDDAGGEKSRSVAGRINEELGVPETAYVLKGGWSAWKRGG